MSAAGCVAADEEAEELLRLAPDPGTLESWISRREQGEPLAWITGRATFCAHELAIDTGLYVPRRQSEELARRAAVFLAARGARAADLCTGVGAIAVHLMHQVPTAKVVAVDTDPLAVECARRNGVQAIVGDCGEPLRAGSFDVVTAVAPYVPTGQLRLLPRDVQTYEPRGALDGGLDGLDVVRQIVVCASRLLRRGAWLLVELGADQDDALRPVLRACGFHLDETWTDESGDLRGLAAQLSGSTT